MIEIDKRPELDQWFLKRWGKFTASENYKLLYPSGVNAWSPGAISYIKNKVLEMSTRLWERPELEEVKSLLHGHIYEYPAFKAMVEVTRLSSMIYLGSDKPLFLEYEALPNESGGSPDALLLKSDGTVDIVAEFKCPRNPMYHFDRLKWKDQWDIKQNYDQCYCQIQNLMLITGAELGLFESFDERFIERGKQTKIIEVYPDRKFQDNLDLRLRMAVKDKHRRYEEYMNN